MQVAWLPLLFPFIPYTMPGFRKWFLMTICVCMSVWGEEKGVCKIEITLNSGLSLFHRFTFSDEVLHFYFLFCVKLPVHPLSKMPRIENDIKLDFKDVLLRPKRSTLKSRSEVGIQLWQHKTWLTSIQMFWMNHYLNLKVIWVSPHPHMHLLHVRREKY